MQFATSILALTAAVAAAKNSIDTGATASFSGDDFATNDAAVKTALEARNDNSAGDWYLNYYNFALSLDQSRQIFAYYPSSKLTGSSTCVGVIGGLDAGAPNGANGGCDSVWGNGCSESIVQAIQGGCNTTMFSGLSPACGNLNVQIMEVDTASFTPADPAVWLTWDYYINSTSEVSEARDLTFPVFARTSDGTANLACLRVNGKASTVGASMASVMVAAGAALYMLM